MATENDTSIRGGGAVEHAAPAADARTDAEPAVMATDAQGQGAAAAMLPAEQGAPKWRLPRGLRIAFGVVAATCLMIAASVAALLYFNLESNPLVGNFVRNRLVSALQERIDPALRLNVESVDLRREDHATVVRISGFRIDDAAGKTMVMAPAGRIELATAPLMVARLVPTAVTLEGLRVALELSDKGDIVVASPDGERAMGDSSAKAEPALADAPIERIKEMIGGAFAGLSAARNAVGGQLPRIGIDDAAITVFDRRTGRRHALSGISSRLTTAADGSASAEAELKTAAGPFAIHLDLSPRTGERQSFKAQTGRLELQDLVALAGIKVDGADLKTPVSMSLQAEVNNAMKAEAARATLTFGALTHALDKKAEPITLDETRVDLKWTEGDDRIAITQLGARSGQTNVALSGAIVPPETADGGWRIQLGGAGLPVEPLTGGDKAFQIDDIKIAMTALPVSRTLLIDKMEVVSGSAQLQLVGKGYLGADDRPGLELSLEAGTVEARQALRLWPNFAAPLVRKWLVEHVKSGKLDSLILALNFPPPVLAAALGEDPLPQDALIVHWKVSQAALSTVPGLPILRGVSSTGEATGRTAKVEIGSGYVDLNQNRKLTLTDATFSVADTSKKPAEGRLRVKFTGTADALAEFARTPGAQGFAPKSLDPAQLSGQVDGEANITLRLVPQMTPQDARVAMTAALKNLSVDKAFGKERLEGGTFQLSMERDAVLLKGDARLMGMPAAIEVKSGSKGVPVANVTMTLDDAARARRGLETGNSLTGPVTVKVAAELDGGTDRDFDVDVDFSRAAISDALPGLSKKPGAPARGRARVRSEGANFVLDKLEFDSGSFQARGNAVVGQDGSFVRAALSSLKMSQGDMLQAEAERSGGILKLTLKGNSFDARPFIKALQTGAVEKSGGKDADIALRSTVLSGFNGELISNADIKLTMRGGGLRRFDLAGRLDGGAINARLQPAAGGQSALVIGAEDAGAFLRFVDFYNRMRGGQMDLTVALGSVRQSGTMRVKSFHLRDEPALRRLVSDTPVTSGGGDAARLDPDFLKRMRSVQDIPFTRLEMSFVRTPGRFDIRDSNLYGPDIGGNVSGVMDYARDLVDLTGTFVPAYTLNNFFAKVPVLGPLLGGGKNEGLFAVRYNITGRLSAPTLSVNPLTAIAPGFLRKLIDFRGMTTGSAAQ